MGFLIGADPKIVFAFWLGLLVVTVAVVMLVVILCMRQAMLHRERSHERAAARWRRILGDAAAGGSLGVGASLGRHELSGFVDAWNHVHDGVGGVPVPALQRIARDIDLERQLYQSLDHGGFHKRVMALVALGFLRSASQFDRIAAHLDDHSSIVSLSAARALMQTDPGRAVAMFVPQIVTRNDWSASGVAAILKEAGAAAVSRELCEVALQANADVAPRLIRFLADVSPEDAAPVIRKILSTSTDEHLISTCLQVMSLTGDLSLVRPLLARDRWHVRMHAAAALGRLGQPGDEQLLLPLLADAQWWVRYRAAQALSRLPFLGEGDVARIRAAQTDRFACDILDQVLAEKTIGAQA